MTNHINIAAISIATSILMTTSLANAADLVTPTSDAPISVEERMAPSAFLEVGGWYGKLNRDGDDLARSEGNGHHFGIWGVDLVGAMEIAPNWLVQGEVHHEKTSGEDGNVDNDLYLGNTTYGGHLAWNSDGNLIGVFGGAGTAYSNEVDQNGDFHFFGGEGRVFYNNFSLAFQGGKINNNDDDGEQFDDGLFLRGIGQVFFNNGNTKLQLDVAKVTGTQDYDQSSANQDDLEIITWGAEIEHGFAMSNQVSSSVFARYEAVNLVEAGNGGDNEIDDQIFLAGIKFRFGGSSLMDRAKSSAPDLPNVGRWLGLTPAVD